MPHPQPHRTRIRTVSRRRLLEGGAAVLGALALSGRPPPTAAAPATDGCGRHPRVERQHRPLPRRHRTAAHHPHAVRGRQTGPRRRPHPLPVPAEPRRQVEVRVRRPPRRPGRRLLPHRRRRQRLGHHPRPLRLAAARLRLPDLRQHHLPVVGSQRPGRGARSRRPRRPATTPSASTGAPSRSPATGRDAATFLHFEGVKSAHYVWINGRVGRLPRGLVRPRRVRHHRAPQARHQPDRRRGLPLLRRRLAGGPGHDPAERHLPLGLPLLDARRAPARLQAGHPAQRRLHGRRAVGHRERAGLRGRARGVVLRRDPAVRRPAATRSGRARLQQTVAPRRRRGDDRTGREGRARAELWSAEHPNLYTAVLRLRDPRARSSRRSPTGSACASSRSRTG